jgi:hypothetical protein
LAGSTGGEKTIVVVLAVTAVVGDPAGSSHADARTASRCSDGAIAVAKINPTPFATIHGFDPMFGPQRRARDGLPQRPSIPLPRRRNQDLE